MQTPSTRGRPDDAAVTIESALADIRALTGDLFDGRVAAARRTLARVHLRAALARRGGGGGRTP
ncbi:MAG: hypothetical protein ACFE0R_02575 [Salinarimonas sp.]